MSDVPNRAAVDGPEEFDLGEIDEAEEIAESGDGEDTEASDAEIGSGEDAEEDHQDDGVDRPQERSSGRRSQTQRLRAEREELRRELADLKRRDQERDAQVRALTQRGPDPAAEARARAAEEEQLSMMSPSEVSRYFYERGQREIGQRMAVMQQQQQEAIDKQGYDAKAATSRVHRQYAERVERVVAEERQRTGQIVPREVALKYLLGEDVMARGMRDEPRQRRAAAARTNGARTRPTGARSDAAVARRPAEDSYEAALARTTGKPLW